MLPLLLGCMVLWFAIGKRSFILFNFAKTKNDARYLSAQESAEAIRSLSSWKTPISAVTTIAPLLGLLGTVMGMIETFEVLAGQSNQTIHSGISTGISKALLTTQFGLVISVPGLLISRLLNKLEEKNANQLSIN